MKQLSRLTLSHGGPCRMRVHLKQPCFHTGISDSRRCHQIQPFLRLNAIPSRLTLPAKYRPSGLCVIGRNSKDD